ncbi:MAG: hypothetical protein Q4A55_00340 [Aerococcus sp.]|nr:hypothetical protein [Aerococcus sp.]
MRTKREPRKDDQQSPKPKMKRPPKHVQMSFSALWKEVLGAVKEGIEEAKREEEEKEQAKSPAATSKSSAKTRLPLNTPKKNQPQQYAAQQAQFENQRNKKPRPAKNGRSDVATKKREQGEASNDKDHTAAFNNYLDDELAKTFADMEVHPPLEVERLNPDHERESLSQDTLRAGVKLATLLEHKY